jgi:membrane fusion protein, protease secretion system
MRSVAGITRSDTHVNSSPKHIIVESTDQPPLPFVKTDSLTHTRLGWWLIVGGMGGFLLWSVLAPLDQGVQVSGTVMVAGNKKAVQHLTGGTVEKILVKEGDLVKTGDLLVKLNGVQAQANAEITRIQYLTTLAVLSRLVAERDGLPAVTFPQEILKAAELDAHLQPMLEVQRQLFGSRREALRSDLAALEQSIAGLQAFGKGFSDSRESKRQQLKLLKEQIDNMRGLAADGYMPRNRLLEQERALAEINSSISGDDGNLGRNLNQIRELQLQTLQIRTNHQKEIQTQLAETQKEVDGLRSRLDGVEYEVASTEVKAPVDGMVADIAVFTNGGVIAPGFRMMDIVPLDMPLVIEGQVPVHLIDSVKPDLKVELIFSAFNQNTTPRVPGVVVRVSPDSLVDEKSGLPYYRMVAEATPEGRKMLSTLQVKPGMPVSIFVSTGEHTLANYLLKPMKDHIRLAFTEE